ncbi:hypothetical protein O0I10_008774 [Lichtheimia ornata]|uniref:Uncharacterized protein n=1 Tax=Lichtheimia ornata TaxID=688661 RepID=A0AAD7UXI4_9FUNG|nr:uncharacterized protein O0I10_008774 [Lichtheimia ornata]KAJ8655488.1 hypothetical protein O0I10_008774 [Lichtheimia ornata]
MLLRLLWIDGAHWPVDRGSLRMYVLLVAVKETLGIQPVGAVVRLELCQLFKKRGVQDGCGSVDMWISKDVDQQRCGSAKGGLIKD